MHAGGGGVEPLADEVDDGGGEEAAVRGAGGVSGEGEGAEVVVGGFEDGEEGLVRDGGAEGREEEVDCPVAGWLGGGGWKG